MTHTPADTGLSPDAAARFDDYLSQVRAALTRAPDVNPDEIEADIRAHVEHELEGKPRPVPLAALAAVLLRLGPPEQWGAGDDPTLLQRTKQLLRERLRGVRGVLLRGPEDWRLTYLSFGVFALGLLTFGALIPVCLPLSYLLSRAALAYARESGRAVGARRWLLYPPVVLVSVALLVAAVVWPVVAGGVTANEVLMAQSRLIRHERRMSGATPEQVEQDRKLLAAVPVAPAFAPAVAGLFVGAGALLLWWTVLGAVAARYPGAVRATFCPLCDGLEPRHGAWLATVCAVLLIPWGAAAYEVVAAWN